MTGELLYPALGGMETVVPIRAYISEDLGSMTYSCYTDHVLRLIIRTHIHPDGTTDTHKAIGSWEDRAALDYTPIYDLNAIQAMLAEWITLDQYQIALAAIEATETVTVTLHAVEGKQWRVDPDSVPVWVTVDVTEGEDGDTVVTFTCAANSGSLRMARIVFETVDV